MLYLPIPNISGDYIDINSGEHYDLVWAETSIDTTPDLVDKISSHSSFEEAINFYNLKYDPTNKNPTPIEEPVEDLSSLSTQKTKLIILLDTIFKKRLKKGYFDQTLNLTLCFEDVDRTQLSQLLVQLDNLEKLNICPSTITFSDFNGGFQTISILEYRGLIARYGAKYIEVWGTKKYYEGLVNSCSDEENMTTLKTQIDNLEL